MHLTEILQGDCQPEADKRNKLSRILKFTDGAHDWKLLLADPDKQWKSGFSARTLAHCWEEAEGFPHEVVAAFSGDSYPLLKDIVPLLAVPEFKVPLPGSSRGNSQNDILVLAQSSAGAVTMMVEGKVDESFDKTLDKWIVNASDGKKSRLQALLKILGLPAKTDGNIRYQLLHRAASAIITAEQYRAKAAVLLIHSFSEKIPQTGWRDYEAFSKLFGVTAEQGSIQLLSSNSKVPLFSAWVKGNSAFLKY